VGAPPPPEDVLTGTHCPPFDTVPWPQVTMGTEFVEDVGFDVPPQPLVLPQPAAAPKAAAKHNADHLEIVFIRPPLCG
jgi:hypothetical protein